MDKKKASQTMAELLLRQQNQIASLMEQIREQSRALADLAQVVNAGIDARYAAKNGGK